MYIVFLSFDLTRALSPLCFLSVYAGTAFICVTSVNNMAAANGKLR